MLQKFLCNICSFQWIFYRKQLLGATVYRGEENLKKTCGTSEKVTETTVLRTILQWLREVFSSNLESDPLAEGDCFIQVWLYIIKGYRKTDSI